jgi:hypothetical protein
LDHALNLPSSHAAVTIWKPHRRRITRATRDNIPNIQLINVFIVVTRSSVPAAQAEDVPAIQLISSTPQSAKFAQKVSQAAKQLVLKIPNHKEIKPHTNNDFLDVFILISWM